MEDIIEGLLEFICFSGSNDKKDGCLVPIVLLIIAVVLCVLWYYFGDQWQKE